MERMVRWGIGGIAVRQGMDLSVYFVDGYGVVMGGHVRARIIFWCSVLLEDDMGHWEER